MQTVILNVFRFSGHTLQQKRRERRAGSGGHAIVNSLKLFVVCRTVVRRQTHTHEQYTRTVRVYFFDDRDEIASHLLQRQTAQAIVGAKFHHDNARSMRYQHWCQAVETSAACFAAGARVNDAIRITLVAQALGEQVDPATLQRNAVGRAQAIPQDEDGWAIRGVISPYRYHPQDQQ